MLNLNLSATFCSNVHCVVYTDHCTNRTKKEHIHTNQIAEKRFLTMCSGDSGSTKILIDTFGMLAIADSLSAMSHGMGAIFSGVFARFLARHRFSEDAARNSGFQ